MHCRGQESSGIVTCDDNSFYTHKGMGLVRNVFADDKFKKLKGHIGIGHTRYSTTAKSEAISSQPFFVHSMVGSLAVAHNGELVNSASLRKMVINYLNIHFLVNVKELCQRFLPEV